jgi:hypothetical protein
VICLNVGHQPVDPAVINRGQPLCSGLAALLFV